MDDAALARLTGWARDQAGLAISAVEPLGSAGRSNVHYRVHADGRRLVLRRPPPTGHLPTAHDMAREHAVLSTLWARGAPVPEPILLCADPDVLGVPFLIMAECPGIVVRGQWTPPVDRPAARSAACGDLVATLALVHQLSWRDTPLREFDRSEPYASRQLRRLGRQWRLAGGDEDSLVEEVRHGLAERFAAAPPRPTSIVHGDYGLHNVVLAPDGNVVAVLDWELWTIGDPLADLAWLLALWAEPGDGPERFDLLGSLTGTAERGCWPRARLAEEYRRRSGTDLTDLPRYLALSFYKLGVIQAGIAHRLRGRSGQDTAAAEFRRRARIAIRTCADELTRA